MVRGAGLSSTMSSYLSQRLHGDDRIRIHPGTDVVAVRGRTRLQGVTLRDRDTGRRHGLSTDALFVMIGAVPETAWLDGLVETDNHGFVLTGVAAGPAATSYESSQRRVFVVGDLRA